MKKNSRISRKLDLWRWGVTVWDYIWAQFRTNRVIGLEIIRRDQNFTNTHTHTHTPRERERERERERGQFYKFCFSAK